MSLLFIWAAIILLFGILEPNTFLTLNNFRTILSDQAITAIMALSLLLPIACNAFDLSVGGAMGLAVIIVTQLMVPVGWSIWLSVVVTLLVGVTIGCANAFFILKLRVNSFIATLGMSTVLIGLQLWFGAVPVAYGVPNAYLNIGRTTFLTIPMFV